MHLFLDFQILLFALAVCPLFRAESTPEESYDGKEYPRYAKALLRLLINWVMPGYMLGHALNLYLADKEDE